MNVSTTRAAEPAAVHAWSMVAVGFVAQGVAYGMTFGMAGTFIGPATDEFTASRAATSLGPSLVALLHGLLGPVVGVWLARHAVRPVLLLGAVLMAAAFGVMHVSRDVWTFSLAYGLLGGAAVSCLGVTPVTALVTRWFPERHGRALGFAFMPIFVTLLPPIAGHINVHYGWRTTALLAALASLALLPLFALVREPASGQAGVVAERMAPAEQPALASRDRFRPDAAFWLLAAAVGIFDGSAITMITHVIPYATEAGIDYQRATLLVSVMGLCGLAGAPLLGTLADRIGGALALALVAVLLAIGWTPYLFDPPFAVLAAAMALLGFCGGAFAALLSTALASRFQGAALAPAVGVAVLVALPFNFVLPLLAGYLHDVTGTYRATFTYQIVMFLFAFVMLRAAAGRTRPNPPLTAPASRRS
jgi:MFS family permease